jgi:hypothetical protein
MINDALFPGRNLNTVKNPYIPKIFCLNGQGQGDCNGAKISVRIAISSSEDNYRSCFPRGVIQRLMPTISPKNQHPIVLPFKSNYAGIPASLASTHTVLPFCVSLLFPHQTSKDTERGLISKGGRLENTS